MVDLKGLHKVKSKGRDYYYAWRGGPRIEAEFGSPEFHAEWQAAKSPEYKGDERKFATWIEKFRRSDEYKDFAASTRRRWDPWLDKIEAEFGALSTVQFDRSQIRVDIKNWRNNWRKTPRTADYGKQVLSRVCAFIVEAGKLRLNPCIGVKNLYDSDRSDIIWTEKDLETLAAHASKEVMWVVKLAALTGLRQGDLLSLSWSQVGKLAIEIKTSKSRRRRRASVPLTQEARDLLETIPKRSTRVFTNSRGQPWRGFSSSFNDAMIESKLSERDLHFHDTRGTAATNYYRADFSIREIAETMGWSEDRVEKLIDLYVKRDEIMTDRIRRLEVLQRSESANENNGR